MVLHCMPLSNAYIMCICACMCTFSMNEADTEGMMDVSPFERLDQQGVGALLAMAVKLFR
jgi:hypothetical protein